MIDKSSRASQVLEVLQKAKEDAEPQPARDTGIPIPISDTGRCETHASKMTGDGAAEYLRSWNTNPLMTKLLKHTAAQDDTSKIDELAAKILDYGKAAVFGRRLCSVHYTDKESFKVRMPKEGKAKKIGGDTWSINTKGQRNEYVEVKTDRYFDAGDEWTTSQVEDTEYDVLQAQTGEAMYNLTKLESQIIIAKFKALQTAAGTAGKVAKSGDYSEATIDTLIELRGKLTAIDRMPSAFVMSENTFTKLLQDEKMQNSEYLTSGNFDYDTGKSTAMFLGASLLPTTLMEDNIIWTIDTNVTMLFGLRRDSLIEPYTRADAGLHGIRLSTRYGLENGRKDGFAWWGA